MNNPYFFFFRCLFFSLLKYKEEKMVVGDLINKFSYRYIEDEKVYFKNILRYIKKSFVLLFYTKSTPNTFHGNATVVYDGKKEFLPLRQYYLDDIKTNNIQFVFRDAIPNYFNFFFKIYYFFLVISVSVFLFPIIIFKNDKAKISLIILELTEILLLYHFFRKNKFENLYIYSAFEKDISFLCYFLKKNEVIKTHIVPSSNPINQLYKTVICDVFIFTAPFQKKEYNELKNNWIVQGFESWPPFGSKTIKLNDIRIKKPFSLGFLSSAMELRKNLKHTNSCEYKDQQAEELLIAALKMIVNKFPFYNLVIYLHPLEKSKPSHLKFSIDYYKSLFGDNVHFAPLELTSKECFDLCSVGIAGFSSAQIERLYGGYKTLFAPMGKLDNYFSDGRLDAISIQNYEQLETMLLRIVEMNENVFFDTFELNDYRWDAYQ